MTAPRQEPSPTGKDAAFAIWGSRNYETPVATHRATISQHDFPDRDPAARAAAWAGLGDALRELTRWQEAAEAFRQAIAAQPDRADAWAGQAIALIGLGDPAQGLAAARQALGIDPTLVEGHRAQALAFLRAGQLDEAEGAIATALGHVPDHPEATAALALIRMMQNRLEEADALFRRAIDAKPTLAEAVGNHATTLARMGRSAEAQRTAAQAIRLKPFLPAPFFLLGNLLRADNRLAEAVEAFAQTLGLAPDHPDARVNLADTLRRVGRFAAAVEICRDGLKRRPNDIRLLVNLGAALQSLGDNDGALDAYYRALDHQSDLPEANNNIARLLQATGRRDAAIAHLQRAVAARPRDAGLARNLSAILLDDGQIAAAETAARQAAEAAPNDPANHRQLALVLIRQDRAGAATAAIDAALRLDPDDGESWFQAAVIFLKAGERARAVPCCREAIRLHPGEGRCWALLAQALRGLRLQAPDPELRTLLIRALQEPGAEHAYLMDAAVSTVLLEPALAAIHTAVHTGTDKGAGTDKVECAGAAIAAVRALLLRADIASGLAGDDLLIALLGTSIVTDAELERTLTVLRHAVLQAALAEGVSVVDHLGWTGLLTALARQCFFNEYVFAEIPAETDAVATLEAELRNIVAQQEKPPPNRVALYACYRPLTGWEGWQRLLTHRNWPDSIRALFTLLIEEPREEAAIAEGLKRLTPVDGNRVSQEVRAQYEACPYPRWVDASLLDAPTPLPGLLRAMFPHVVIPPDPRWNAPEVLVTGCGTGRESVWVANQIAGAQVLAVDLSLASLAYAQRQARRLGITGITYAQADLLELGGLTLDGNRRQFDIIHAVGVLHHLADPLAGWRVLTDLLRPGGAMKVGLYSAKARIAVVAARDLITQAGFGATLAGIRAFRSVARGLADDHPARVIVDSPDFYNVSACRDLVFHVQEHQMTLPQIAGWIADLGLEFLGFQLDDLDIGLSYRRQFPNDPTMTDLAAWDRFEAECPQIFSGMYQFWVRRPA